MLITYTHSYLFNNIMEPLSTHIQSLDYTYDIIDFESLLSSTYVYTKNKTSMMRMRTLKYLLEVCCVFALLGALSSLLMETV